MSDTAVPYLSVVATARNDDHGGNPLYRMQLFVDGLVAQSDKFELPTELVLVEWNPPDDRPRLADMLEWPQGRGYCTVRIVAVPAELHSKLDHSDRLPLFQMIGKNVGIRRARGEFVVATNIDILFSDGLMRYLAGRKLRRGHVYRADRFDVPAEIERAWPIEVQLEFCDLSAIRVNRREGTLDLRSGHFFRIYPDISPLVWLRNSPSGWRLLNSQAGRRIGFRRLMLAPAVPHVGVFGRVADLRRSEAVRARIWRFRVRLLAFRIYAFVYWIVAAFNEPRRVPHRVGRLLRSDNQAGSPHQKRPATQSLGHSGGYATLPLVLARGLSRAAKRQWYATGVVQSDELARVRLHTNASGDFTLMSRPDWLASGGYAELEMYSMHIDGLLLYVAHYSGIAERFLPFPVYHIEHGGGFRPEATGDDALDAALAKRAIPQISNEQLMEYIRTMYHERAPIRLNGEDWGFASVSLVETRPQEKRAMADTMAPGSDR